MMVDFVVGLQSFIPFVRSCMCRFLGGREGDEGENTRRNGKKSQYTRKDLDEYAILVFMADNAHPSIGG